MNRGDPPVYRLDPQGIANVVSKATLLVDARRRAMDMTPKPIPKQGLRAVQPDEEGA